MERNDALLEENAGVVEENIKLRGENERVKEEGSGMVEAVRGRGGRSGCWGWRMRNWVV